jgi:hypothetical protein
MSGGGPDPMDPSGYMSVNNYKSDNFSMIVIRHELNIMRTTYMNAEDNK